VGRSFRPKAGRNRSQESSKEEEVAKEAEATPAATADFHPKDLPKRKKKGGAWGESLPDEREILGSGPKKRHRNPVAGYLKKRKTKSFFMMSQRQTDSFDRSTGRRWDYEAGSYVFRGEPSIENHRGGLLTHLMEGGGQRKVGQKANR